MGVRRPEALIVMAPEVGWSTKDPRPYGPGRGRKAMSELVSHDEWGSAGPRP